MKRPRAFLSLAVGRLPVTGIVSFLPWLPLGGAPPAEAARISFLNDLIPVLSKAGCNQGTCHGSESGKGGFKLSLRGFAPERDFQALSRDFFGRRINLVRPEESLIIQTLPLEKIANMSPPPALGRERGARRQRLFRTITDLLRHVESDQTLALDSACERAFALATSPRAKAAFDLSREPEPMRDRYGRYPFGQGVLMARRLVEAGVRFVQVNWREHPINEYGFDNHGENFRKLKEEQLPQIDQTVSALLEDLDARGLLESTVVLATGEFGRTPKINGAAGRDHWPFVFSYLIAGGGIPGGRVIGSSDEIAAYPVDDPVSPQNTVASIYGLVGLDLEKLKAAKIIEETDGIPHLLG